MGINELKLKLLLKKIELAEKLNSLDGESEEFADLSYKFTFLLGVLSGLDMIIVSGEMEKELFELFSDKNGNRKEFIEKIYKE